MATTMVPEAPAPAPRPPATPGGIRFVEVRANLLPDEVLSARQGVIVRKRVLLGIAVLVVLLIGWFGYSRWQTSSARSDLDNLQSQNLALQSQQQQFQPLVEAQTNVAAIKTELAQAMTGDLSWKTLLATLRSSAPSGLQLTNVSAQTTPSGSAGTGQPTVGAQPVGTANLTGTANSKAAVAAYADRLAKAKGLATPLITNVAAASQSSVTFSITVVITSDALGGRYSTAPPNPTAGGN
jgi:Tfp pilus assembly protein PilN